MFKVIFELFAFGWGFRLMKSKNCIALKVARESEFSFRKGEK